MSEIETLVHKASGKLVSLLPWYHIEGQRVELTESGSERHGLKVGAVGVVTNACLQFNQKYVSNNQDRNFPLVEFQTIDGAESGIFKVEEFGERIALRIDNPDHIDVIED